MDVQDWKLLLALEEKKSMGKAGEQLYLSQPAVSYRMDRMEKEFETKLFIRSHSGIRFTAAGQKLYAYADDMLKRTSGILQEVQTVGNGLSGNITVGSSSTFLSHFLPRQLKSFHELYPSVTVSLVTKRNDILIQMLKNGQLSLAVVRGEHEWNECSFPLYDDPLVLICSHPCTTEELKSLPYIPYSGDPELMGAINAWGRRTLGGPFVTTTDATRVTGPQICVQLVKAGLGWSVVPLTRIIGEPSLFRQTIRTEPALTRRTRLLYTRAARGIQLYRVYIDHFCSYFASYDFQKI